MQVTFDPTRPYTTVHGIPGLAYQQDGLSFNGRGELIEDPSTVKRIDVEEVLPEEDENDLPRCIEQAEIPTAETAGSDELELMHWAKLKILLKTYGEEYTTREAALAFLRGK